MAKFLSDTALDSLLDYIATATEITVCSDVPDTYLKAHTTYMLATQTVDSGDFTKADDTSGRKVTVGAQNGVTVTNAGTAKYIALTIPASSALIGYTTCTDQVISSTANTINIPAFKWSISDPT